jgi:molybdopterin/thiamine biosynthesis adenylyltransferase
MDNHVVVVGVGNIGSHTCDLVARLPEVARITLVDPDSYTDANIATQRINRADVGRPKSVVQARILRRMRRDLEVIPIAARVEDVPWGYLRADMLCACLDTRISRMYCNEVAWRLGVPWIDAGVSGGDLLARVNVYLPAMDAPCFECGLSDSHYETLEIAYRCKPEAVTHGSSSGSPAYLGALAASLQVAECHKLLRGQSDQSLAGRQVLVDARNHRHYVTRYPRNPECRFDHLVLGNAPTPSPARLTVRQALALAPAGANGAVALQSPGRHFVRKLTCAACGATIEGLRLIANGQSSRVPCPSCRAMMESNPFTRFDALRADDVDATTARRTLRSLGFHPGDILTVSGPNGGNLFALTASERRCNREHNRG